MQRNWIQKVHSVPELGQPDGISPWTPADVRDLSRWGRKVALEQCLGACKFERAWPAREPVALEAMGVVRRNVVRLAC